jgi:hypothetical protein
VLLQLIGNDGITKDDVLAEMSSIDLTDEQTLALIDDLIAKRLLGWDRDTLVFLTRRYATAYAPKDGIVAHDMEDERFADGCRERNAGINRPHLWSDSYPRGQLSAVMQPLVH